MHYFNKSFLSSRDPQRGRRFIQPERLLDRWEGSRWFRTAWYLFLISLLTLLIHNAASAQTGPAGLSAISNVDVVGQGEEFEVVVRLDSASAAYYFESEITVEPAILTFRATQADSLLGDSDGISVGDMLSHNTVGVSASRTSGEAVGPGRLMRIHFGVKASADTGLTTIQFQQSVLKNAEGQEVPTAEPPALEIKVKPRLTGGGLVQQADTIHEAQTIPLQAYAFAREVTDVSTPSDCLKVWIALSNVDTDPAAWPEEQWRRADPGVQTASGARQYGVEFGPALDVGQWYYVARMQLNDRAYRYGGFAADTGRFWHADSAPSGRLTVQERPPYAHILARWDFDDRDRTVDQALSINRFAAVTLSGSRLDGFDERNRGFSMATASWHAEEGTDSVKFLKTRLATNGFQQIRVSSAFKGTGSAARDFQLEVSLDDSTWTEVPGGAVQVGEDWTTGRLREVELPVTANDRDSLFIRWQRIGDTRVDGTADISSQGKVRIDDITVTGTALNPKTPTVWPGDADNDGTVTAADVLPLGTWWGLKGPDRILRNVSWSGLEAIGWFPFEATFADTDGSGYVNHSDLEAVGLNYGQSRQQTAVQSAGSAPPELMLPALKEGEDHYIAVQTDEPVDLSGLSVNLKVKGTDGDFTPAKEILAPVFDAGDWLYGWDRQDKLLSFARKGEARWSGAWVHKGWTQPKRAERLMRFRVTAATDWPGPVTVKATDVRISRPDMPARSLNDFSLIHSTATGIDKGEENGQLPRKTRLIPNFPNPFNPSTRLRYQLAKPGEISLHIYSLLGKRVATLVDRQYQRAGTYSHTWDATGFSSGVYMYILDTGSSKLSGKMLLVK